MFDHNLIIPHIQQEGKYKLGELPIYLVGSRDICEGVNYVHSSRQGLNVSDAEKALQQVRDRWAPEV